MDVHARANSEPADALAALNDARAVMKRQTGCVSETFLTMLNPANPPHGVHVSRWASMKCQADLFSTPELARLNAHDRANDHANEHYTIVAVGWVPAALLPHEAQSGTQRRPAPIKPSFTRLAPRGAPA